MECPRNPGKMFTWWYFDEVVRRRDSYEAMEELPSPQFCYEHRDKDGVPIISGYCPVCGSVHRLGEDSALKIAKEFDL